MNDHDSADTSSSDLPPPLATEDIVDEVPTSEPPPVDEPATDAEPDIDLDAIQRDLDGVQTALDRLNDGSYWTDEVTGDAIADDVLAAFPLTRTVSSHAAQSAADNAADNAADSTPA